MQDANEKSPRALGLISLKGFCMGAADVVPGVSGGTMALILGIYQRLLNAIGAFDFRLIKMIVRGEFSEALKATDLKFLVALGVGILTAVAFFTRVVPLPKLIGTHPELVYGLFFGLILGSIYVLLRALPAPKTVHLVMLLIGGVVGFLIVTLVPTSTPDAWWFILLSGCLAITAMILPGISGSFILLILQKYAYVLDAVGRLDFSVIVPFAAGCALGLLAFARVLAWLLGRFYQGTLTAIIGLLIASLYRIWPFQDRVFGTVRDKERLIESTPMWPQVLDANVGWALLLAIVGLAGVIAITALVGKTDRA
jgi:putative membrane protein